MKKFLRSLIKIIFVVVQPILATVTLAAIVFNDGFISTPLVWTGLVLSYFTVLILAVIVYNYLPKVSMLPKFDIEFLPLVGIGIGVDLGYNGKDMSVIIFIPFVSLEIKQQV
jgi:hypothetical protein